jgi:mannose-6-phosphate isomerase-like protein (cupin superfamily)
LRPRASPPQPASQPAQDAGRDAEGKPLPGTTLGALPQGTPLSWHLDTFPDRAAAEAVKEQLGTVAEAFDRTWLFTIAPLGWRPAATSEHVATVGPLPLEPRAVAYTAMYLATAFRPGLSRFVHERPRPEAWFILTGEQCLETPDGPVRGRAGDGVVVRGGLPTTIQATGNEIQRNLTLVLHDAAKAATTRVDHWKPRGLCRD